MVNYTPGCMSLCLCYMNAAHSERPPLLPPKVAIPAEQAKAMRFVSRAQAMVAKAMVSEEGEAIAWPPVLQSQLEQLTFKQRQYAIRVAGGQHHVEAYRLSYNVSEERADNALSSDIAQLNRHPRITTCVELIRSYLSRQWLSESVEVKEHAAAVLYEASVWGDTTAAKIKAAETLLRMHGLLVDKKEITHRDVNELDEQAAIFRSILADVNLSPVLDAEYVQCTQQLTGPSLGYVCPSCNSRAKLLSSEYEDGDGI